MNICHTSQDVEKYKGDMIVYFVHRQDKKAPVCDNTYVRDTVKLAFKALPAMNIFTLFSG